MFTRSSYSLGAVLLLAPCLVLSAVVRSVSESENVLGTKLQKCSMSPKTGFYRTGFCETGRDDADTHTVCAQATDAFLAFSKEKGNDLSTPHPELRFPGLKSGDHWCLCAMRYKEALKAGKEPDVVLAATHKHTLDIVSLADLKKI